MAPAGDEATQVIGLFWVMVAGGAVIWCGVVLLQLYALRRRGESLSREAAARLIFWGGAVFPALVLTALLAFALWMMPGLRPEPEDGEQGGLRIVVTGKQFWWDVLYELPEGGRIRTANEVVLPVGERVEFILESPDVIHSFWIPSLAGKMDMIPGRSNRLSVRATKPGVYRGACAEYCGPSHALMALSATVLDREAFDDWVRRSSVPAAAASAPGSEAFMRHGCGSCHAVAGTAAAGRVGPDLSHIGSRDRIGAGTLVNGEDALVRFIARSGDVKPGSQMPNFDMIPEADLRAIARWLVELK